MNRMKKMLCALLAMVMVAGVCVMPTEARSDNAKVKALQEMIDNAENGTTVTLTEDLLWADGEPVEIPAGKNIIVDLNGYKMESLEPYPIFRVMSGAEVTIKSRIGWDSYSNYIAKNAAMPDEYAQYYDAETMGLFEVQENAKLTIESGAFEAGANYFTGNSKGEVYINGGYFHAIPEGTYTLKKGYQFEDSVNYGVTWWSLEDVLYSSFAHYIYNFDIPVGEKMQFDLIVLNKADYALENLEIEAAYLLENRDKVLFTEVISDDKYEMNGTEIHIPKIESGEKIIIKYIGVISEEMLDKEIVLAHNVDMIENSESVYQTGETRWCGIGISQSIDKDESVTPVEKVTFVENEETNTAIKTETAAIVVDVMKGFGGEGKVTAETSEKIFDAIDAEVPFWGEVSVRELTTDEVEQITETDRIAIKNNIINILGESAKWQYLDLTFALMGDGEILGTLNRLEDELPITIAIPEDLKADARTYKVIRNHNGEITVLDTVVNEDGTISFKTDRFSTYALAYADKSVTTPPSTDENKVTNVTIVEDKKTEEAVKQETQKVVADIVAGDVSNSVVDEKTAEKVAEAINNGENVTAEIVVKEMKQEEISQNDKAVIEDKVTAELGADAKVQYLDVSIVLIAGDEELGTLNKLEEEITITVAIPEELKAEGRTYKVIRNHNGEVTVLDTVVNEDGTISFKTDRFSTYALAYADKEETNTNPVVKPVTPSTDSKAPQTGDSSSVMIYVAMCFVALLAIVAVRKRSMFVK